MRKLYKPPTKDPIKSAKRMSIEHNVTFNVIDVTTGDIVSSHTGHNAATNSILTGIGHYLIGDGVYNQAYDMLARYVPRYISLGTMGLISQEQDEQGLPTGLGSFDDSMDDSSYYGDAATQRICHYASECPGFGADGYNANKNNGRPYFGLGPQYKDREKAGTAYCELIDPNYPRAEISFREIVPESDAEIPSTIDVVFSGMVSTGALAQFREPGKDYVFITEAGLWTRKDYSSGGDNGLLAGYRIVPPSQTNWDFGTYVEGTYNEQGEQITPPHYEFDPEDPEHAEKQKQNQLLLRKNILKVGRNQIVQVIWKIQLGGLEQLGGMSELYPSLESKLIWHIWD